MSFYKNVAVLGAGTMGHALALVHADNGCKVKLFDTSDAALNRARGLIETALETLVEAGEKTVEESTLTISRIFFENSITAALNEADLIVEAVTEDENIKKELYLKIEELALPHTVVASNTSFLNIFPLVPPSLLNRTMIVHWYTPPYIIDLVDVVPSDGCNSRDTQRMMSFLSSMGKQPILFRKFLPGYIANRIQGAINQEVFRLLDEEVASPEDIDCSIVHGLALRLAVLGQLQKIDYTGLDVAQKVFESRSVGNSTAISRCRTLDKLVSEGSIGVTAGKGFYNYDGQTPDQLYRKRDLDLLALRRSMAQLSNSKPSK